MTGGFVGEEAVIKDQDRSRIESQMKLLLTSELILEARTKVSEDFVLIPSLSVVIFKDLPQTESAEKNNATLNMQANYLGVMFKKNVLYTHLVSGKTRISPGDLVDIGMFDSLDFNFSGTVPLDLTFSEEINFSVNGKSEIIWRTDEVALKADLVGKNKKDISSIINNYSSISSVTYTIRPFWKSSFPTDSAHISIKKLPVK
jgi:hypothetical protein